MGGHYYLSHSRLALANAPIAALTSLVTSVLGMMNTVSEVTMHHSLVTLEVITFHYGPYSCDQMIFGSSKSPKL